MLAIRLQRYGRKGYATYRFIIQESSKSPTSGRVVAQIGSYNPHTKDVSIDKEKVKFYLDNGAQPSERVANILKSQKIKLPDWVKKSTKLKRSVRNPDKLRKNQPAEEKPKPSEPEAKPEESDKPTDSEEKTEQKEAPAEDTAKTDDSADAKEPENQPAEDQKQ